MPHGSDHPTFYMVLELVLRTRNTAHHCNREDLIAGLHKAVQNGGRAGAGTGLAARHRR